MGINESSNEGIDINAPRLVHGTQIINLDSIFQHGLDQNKEGINYCGTKSIGRAIHFNVVGVVPQIRLKVTEYGYTQDTEVRCGKFGDDYFKNFECYLLIDETVLLKAHQDLLRAFNIPSTSLRINELRFLTNQNILIIFGEDKNMIHQSGWNHCNDIKGGNFGLVDPKKIYPGDGAVEAVSIDLIRQIKSTRALPVAMRTEKIQSRDACNFGGVFTTHKIAINGVIGIVLSPIQTRARNISYFTSTEDEINYIIKLQNKHRAQIPIYNCNGDLLYQPNQT